MINMNQNINDLDKINNPLGYDKYTRFKTYTPKSEIIKMDNFPSQKARDDAVS